MTVRDVVLTIREAAELYRVSERTMWKLVQEGEVPHFRVGKQIRFYRDQLLECGQEEGR